MALRSAMPQGQQAPLVLGCQLVLEAQVAPADRLGMFAQAVLCPETREFRVLSLGLVLAAVDAFLVRLSASGQSALDA